MFEKIERTINQKLTIQR